MLRATRTARFVNCISNDRLPFLTTYFSFFLDKYNLELLETYLRSTINVEKLIGLAVVSINAIENISNFQVPSTIQRRLILRVGLTKINNKN